MRKLSILLTNLVLALALSFAAGHAPGTTGAAGAALLPPDGYAQHVLGILIDARRAAGLADPELDLVLVDLASQRSADMAARDYFSHYTPEGGTIFDLLAWSSTPWGYAGETLQRNNYPDEQTAVVAAQSLLDSPPHRAIIMDPQYTAIGIGHAVDPYGMHYYTIVWVNR